jgi:3-dehydroquinate synthetase
VVEPEFIVVDFDFLKTLNRREILNGISESIKHAIIQDEDLFNWYATHDA